MRHNSNMVFLIMFIILLFVKFECYFILREIGFCLSIFIAMMFSSCHGKIIIRIGQFVFRIIVVLAAFYFMRNALYANCPIENARVLYL